MPSDLPAVARSAQAYSRLLRQAGGGMLDITSLRSDSGLLVALYESPPYDLQVPAMHVARLSINLRQAAVSGRFGDDRSKEYPGRRYSMFLAPAHVEAQWRKRSESRHITIYFSSAVLDAGENSCHGLRLGDEPLVDYCSPALRTWIDALEQSLSYGDPVAEAASVGLARLILAGVARRHEQAPQRLSPTDLQTLTRHVQGNLEGPLRIADLAGLLGMRPHRFALAFALTAGRPPHRFVLECRLARAMDLLQRSRRPIAEVAAACGFSSQQHLTSALRQSHGTTPARARHSAQPLRPA